MKQTPGCITQMYLYLSRPPVTQSYNQGAVNLSEQHSNYPQQYVPPPTMHQVTNQMSGMQLTPGSPTLAGPGCGTSEFK